MSAHVVERGGPLFTNGTHVLAGYQGDSERGPKFISGIGGKRNEGEYILDTIIREAIEELFDIKTLPPGLMARIHEKCISSAVVINDGYCLARYTFKDLETILNISAEEGVRSPLYEFMPLTLMDLILLRRPINNPEIECLVLMPFVNHTNESILERSFVKRHFLRDMALLH